MLSIQESFTWPLLRREWIPKTMRTMLRYLSFFISIAALPRETSAAGSAAEFYSKYLPAGVALGMSPAALQSVRGNLKLGTPFGAFETAVSMDEMYESSEDRDNKGVVWYRFRDGKLSVVFQSKFTSRIPIEHTRAAVVRILDDLKASFAFLSSEQIVQDSGDVAVLVNAYVWADRAKGNRVFFSATNREINTIIFDPDHFRIKDSFLGPESLKETQAGIDRVLKSGGYDPSQNARSQFTLVDFLGNAELEKAGRSLPVKEVSTSSQDPVKAEDSSLHREIGQPELNRSKWLWTGVGAAFVLLLISFLKISRGSLLKRIHKGTRKGRGTDWNGT